MTLNSKHIDNTTFNIVARDKCNYRDTIHDQKKNRDTVIAEYLQRTIFSIQGRNCFFSRFLTFTHGRNNWMLWNLYQYHFIRYSITLCYFSHLQKEKPMIQYILCPLSFIVNTSKIAIPGRGIAQESKKLIIQSNDMQVHHLPAVHTNQDGALILKTLQQQQQQYQE